MKREFKPNKNDWHYCHECQIKRGGKVPKNQGGITMTSGICSLCGLKKTLVPNDDYVWKDKNAVWD